MLLLLAALIGFADDPVPPTPATEPVPPAPPVEPVALAPPEPAALVTAPPGESVPQVEPNELTPKRRALPTWPTGIKSASCQFRVWIDEEGKPYQVRPVACDEAVTEVAVDALERWRWKPYLVDGRPSKVSTVITIQFRRD